MLLQNMQLVRAWLCCVYYPHSFSFHHPVNRGFHHLDSDLGPRATSFWGEHDEQTNGEQESKTAMQPVVTRRFGVVHVLSSVCCVFVACLLQRYKL